MKNPYSKNTRAVDTVGKALFESGPYNDSAVGAGLIFGAAMISIFVGLVGIGSFPLLVILLCTCIPFVICGTLALWLGFGAPPDYTVYEKISYAYKKSQLCSNMCRDVAESIVRDMVRISNSDAPKDYKTDSLDKRTKVLNTLYDEDVKLQNEIAKDNVDSSVLNEVENTINAMAQARAELIDRRQISRASN